MSLKGSIGLLSMAEVLQHCARQSGPFELILEGGMPKIRIIIHGHGPNIHSVDQPRRPSHTLLGERLRRAGRIDRGQLKAALRSQKKSRSLLGDILTSDGTISQDILDDALNLQAKETVLQAFEWSDGSYNIAPLPKGDMRRVTTITIEELQVTAFKMLDEWPLIRSRINNYSVVYRRSGSKVLDDEDSQKKRSQHDSLRQVLDLVDSSRDVNELIDRSGLGEFETCKALTHLLSSGQIVPVTIKSAEANPSRHKKSLFGYRLKIIIWNACLIAMAALGFRALGSPIDNFEIRGDLNVWADGYHQARYFNMMRTLESALEIHYTQHGRYPDSLEELVDAKLVSEADVLSVQYRDVRYLSIGSDYEFATGE